MPTLYMCPTCKLFDMSAKMAASHGLRTDHRIMNSTAEARFEAEQPRIPGTNVAKQTPSELARLTAKMEEPHGDKIWTPPSLLGYDAPHDANCRCYQCQKAFIDRMERGDAV